MLFASLSGLGLLGPGLGLRVPRLRAAALRGQHHGGAPGGLGELKRGIKR